MIDLKVQLVPLLQKDPIVSTFDSRTTIDHPEEVIAAYNLHAATYVKFDLLGDIEQRFIQKITKGLTPKACLVARYGYGKTTAAIGLWQACCKANILAVPPIGYTSIAGIATTAYSWTRTAFSDNTDVLTKLRELYTTYLHSSTEELAKLVSKRSGQSYEQVMAVLTDPALEGALRLDPPTTNIVLFLDALTHIVTANGYLGIAIFVDEFQQLLGNASAEILNSLRSLVWGLRTRQIPFGLALTMDPRSEEVLGERAGDILHRIKDDDLYLDFRQIHSIEFPKLLWERYAEQLELGELTFRIVDKPALTALGQICDRPDLSNGPRTVANTFRRIASYYARNERTYTPLQLIDDFLTGDIIFDGDANTIASLITEFAGYAYFKHTDANLAVLKLLAAFPAGCPPELAERYGILETFKQVTSDLRGDIVTLLPGGYALIELQRVGKPQNQLSLILKKYWMQITGVKGESAEDIRRFTTYVLPLLFPEGSSQAESWDVESGPYLTTDNSYEQVFVGHVHSRHPLRRVRVIVCSEEPGSLQDSAIADITVIFLLSNDSFNESQRALKQPDGSLVFILNMSRSPQDSLPPDLRIVEHNLSPQPSTPAVLLSVIEFVEREISTITLKVAEQARVNHTLESLRRWLLNFIFDDQLLKLIDAEAATPGYRGVRDLLFRECERRFPDYNSLITSSIWRDNLTTYRNVLSERTLAERRGIEAVEGPKAMLADLFGQRNHAGFDSKMRVQYPALIEVTWTGEQGALLFTLHPLETKILTSLKDNGHLYDDIVKICRVEGYSREEIEEVVKLLITRGYIKEEAGRIFKLDTISASEIRRLRADLVVELQALKMILPLEDLTKAIDTAQLLTEMDVDADAVRQQAHARLVSLTEKMKELRKSARLTFIEQLEEQRNSIIALLRSLDKSIPGFSAETSFKNHLDGARKRLEDRKVSLQHSAVRLRDALQILRNKASAIPDSEIGSFLMHEVALQRHREALNVLQIEVQSHLLLVDLLSRWINWGSAFVRLRQNVTNLLLSLEQPAPISGNLTQRLDDIERGVREQLAQQGLSSLLFISEAQQSLDEVAQDYDRNLLEREKAFEREKFGLETQLSITVGREVLLRGKYQISKHTESYEDVYLEAVQAAQEALQSLSARARILEIRVDDMEKQGLQKQAAVDRKKIKTLIRQMAESKESLSPQKNASPLPLGVRCKDVLPRMTLIREQINEIEARMPSQTMLPLTAAVLLSKLTSHPQDVGEIIDLNAAIAVLPPESELTALLKLCLDGSITLRIWVEDKMKTI